MSCKLFVVEREKHLDIPYGSCGITLVLVARPHHVNYVVIQLGKTSPEYTKSISIFVLFLNFADFFASNIFKDY